LLDSDDSFIKKTKCLQIQTTEIAGGNTLAHGPLLRATIEGNVSAARKDLGVMTRTIHVDDDLQIDLENDIQTNEMITEGDEENIL
jgi:hypothetical protein